MNEEPISWIQVGPLRATAASFQLVDPQGHAAMIVDRSGARDDEGNSLVWNRIREIDLVMTRLGKRAEGWAKFWRINYAILWRSGTFPPNPCDYMVAFSGSAAADDVVGEIPPRNKHVPDYLRRDVSKFVRRLGKADLREKMLANPESALREFVAERPKLVKFTTSSQTSSEP
jgi:hypothetical protein